MKQARDWSPPRRSHHNVSRGHEEWPPLNRNCGEESQTQRPRTADACSFNNNNNRRSNLVHQRDRLTSHQYNNNQTWRYNDNFQRVNNDQRQSGNNVNSDVNREQTWRNNSGQQSWRNNSGQQSWRNNREQQSWRNNIPRNINQQQTWRSNNNSTSVDQTWSSVHNNISSNINTERRRTPRSNGLPELQRNVDEQRKRLPQNKHKVQSRDNYLRTSSGESRGHDASVRSNDNKLEEQVSGSNFQLRMYRQAVLSPEHDDEGWPHIVGSCLDMCPAEERDKRARLRDLAVFERLDGDQSRTSKELAVKKFCRTFSGKDLKHSDVRPLLVLCYTMEHLVRILDMGDYPFEMVHDFLFDRTRAIRQELSMQRIINELAVSIYENIVRFHIMSERELRQQRASGKVFDSHLNFQQLSKALLSLMNLYLLSNDTGLENETEFYCYYVLLNLSRPQQLALWFQSVNTALLRSEHMQFALDVLKCYQQNNHRGFFRLATKATYLQACLVELYFNEVRAVAIKMINYGGYKLHPYPLCELANSLLMEPDDMEEFCSLHGLAVGVSASNEVQLLAKQAEFTPPKQPLRHYHCQLIENRRPSKFQDLCKHQCSYVCLVDHKTLGSFDFKILCVSGLGSRLKYKAEREIQDTGNGSSVWEQACAGCGPGRITQED